MLENKVLQSILLEILLKTDMYIVNVFITSILTYAFLYFT